jgi:hypothetical protein
MSARAATDWSANAFALRVSAQPGQQRQRQRPRPLELHCDVQVRDLGPQVEGLAQVGGGLRRLPDAGPGPAADDRGWDIQKRGL